MRGGLLIWGGGGLGMYRASRSRSQLGKLGSVLILVTLEVGYNSLISYLREVLIIFQGSSGSGPYIFQVLSRG